jgi:hypothetical protein
MSLSAESRRNSLMATIVTSARMMILENLSPQDRRTLKNQALRRLQRAFRSENFRTVEFENEELIIDQIIKYLHSLARFSVVATVEEFEIEEPLIKLMKPTINSIIIRIFVGLVKDSTLNKM